MKFFRLDLLTLLISLFILNSCKNEGTIGLNVTAAGQISGSLVDTATVFTNTTTDDSVQTSSTSKAPMGYFVDPVLGTTESDLVTDLNLPLSTAYTLPTGKITIDSAVLILKYADGFYGDSISTKYQVNVFQLTGNRLSSNQAYYSNDTWTYNANNIVGSKTFFARPRDSVKVTTIVSGGPDTLVKLVPQLRIPIQPSFIEQILFGAPAEQLSSNLIFNNNVKGLFVTLNKNQTIGPGGIFMFTPPADSSLAIYYKAVTGTTVDTSVVYLDMSLHASQIRHSYSQQVLNALNHTKPSDSLIYLQGLASLRAKISFPYIASLFSAKNIGSNYNVIINRAEIVLSINPGSDIPAYLIPQPELTVYRYDIAHQRTSIEDAATQDPRHYANADFGGYFNTTTANYHFLVTSYLQDLIAGKIIDYGTYIAPIDTTNTSSISISPTPETSGRVVAVGTNKSSPYHIMLNVIYTKIRKQ